MPNLSTDHPIPRESITGATIYDTNGTTIGTAQHLWVDRASDEPLFVTVNLGLFGTEDTFVPVADVIPHQDGYQVPLEKEFIEGAPSIGAVSELSTQQQAEIFSYYAMDIPPSTEDLAGPRKAGVDGGLAAEVINREGREEGIIPGRRHPEADSDNSDNTDDAERTGAPVILKRLT